MFLEIVAACALALPDKVLGVLIASPIPGSGTLLTTMYNLLGYGEINGVIYQEQGVVVLFAPFLDTLVNG